jgi:hypothetical protein
MKHQQHMSNSTEIFLLSFDKDRFGVKKERKKEKKKISQIKFNSLFSLNYHFSPNSNLLFCACFSISLSLSLE